MKRSSKTFTQAQINIVSHAPPVPTSNIFNLLSHEYMNYNDTDDSSITKTPKIKNYIDKTSPNHNTSTSRLAKSNGGSEEETKN